MSLSSSRGPILIVIAAVCLSLIVGGGYLYWLGASPPAPGSPAYEQYVNEFQVGVAALDADLPLVAEDRLSRAVKLVPREPAGWADRGLLYLRTGRLPEATADLEQAARLAPDDPEIRKLLGLLKQRLGRFGEAAEHLRRAIEQDVDDIKSLYLLAQVVDQEHLEGSDTKYQRLLEQILAVRPDNLRVLIDRLRVAVRRSDKVAVRETLKRFDELSPGWLERTRTALIELKLSLAESLGAEAVPRLLRFNNTLKGEPRFAGHVADVLPRDEFAGTSLQQFRWLPPVRHSPAPADFGLSFTPDPVQGVPEGRWEVALPIWMNSEAAAVVFVANGREMRRSGDKAAIPASPAASFGVVPMDWNNDLRTDLFLAGPDGLRFHQQHSDGTLLDTTAQTGLSKVELQAAYHSALAADVDLDGDLDLLVSRAVGGPRFLRNNFDGTFTSQPIFPNVEGPLTIAWADYDHDGAPDAALLDATGKLHVFSNGRSGQFMRWSAAPPAEKLLTISSADTNDDGVFDIIALRDDGALLSLSDRHKQSTWVVTELAKWTAISADKSSVVSLLLAADFDNNGALDLLASGLRHSAIWLGTGSGRFEPLAAQLPPRIMAAADLRDNGRMDLIGIDQAGRPVQLRNAGQLNYHWQTIRPRAARGEIDGDNRINSFGIGGDIEVRAGTHVVKQPILAPAVHFGLGERPLADIVRLQWPNGSFQFEFSPTVNQSVVAIQRLKGSCPFLFAWDGKQYTFVTDFMWSTPLGMYINSSNKGGFLQTTDWVKIPGEQLAARDGQYELRVNANLWETHFFDHLSLMTVDHPADTEMFVDERFFMEPTSPILTLTDTPRNVARVTDDNGRDATHEVQANDGVYLDHIQRGRYQGVCKEHWVEVDLGEGELPEGPLWLVARGWMHPTDSSVNYALEQGRHIKPRGLVLEIPDGQGGWKVARDKLGFPTGKNKTILLRLDGLHGEAGVPRRFRLRTNLEIYWDSLLIAHGLEDSLAKRQVLNADRAELGFRGIVAMTQANPSSPELPHYDEVVSTGQHWRDLIGYHTRHGDINELLTKIDDRYAIICAGDEVVMRFAAPPAPPKGWKRDFVWIADGWVKDGDYNTRFGKTVLPLPAHDMPGYDVPPGQLEDDPVYRRFPQDWQTYHTRYVTPRLYEGGLRNFLLPGKRTDGGRP